MQKQLVSLINDAYKLAAKMLNQPADAYDVIQDAAAIALSNSRAKTLSADSFKPWFFKVVRNKSIDKLRANNRELRRSTNEENLSHEPPNSHGNDITQVSEVLEPSGLLTQAQLKQNINKALEKVSVAHREIVLLKDYHNFSYSEIAEILGIAPGSVMSRLHRARLALRVELAKLVEHGDYYE